MLTLRLTIPSRVTNRFTSSSGSGAAGPAITGVVAWTGGLAELSAGGVTMGGAAVIGGGTLPVGGVRGGAAPMVGGFAVVTGVSTGGVTAATVGGAAVVVGGAAVTGWFGTSFEA